MSLFQFTSNKGEKEEGNEKKHVARCRHPLPYIYISITQRSDDLCERTRKPTARPRPRLFPSVLQKSINKQQKSRLWLLSYFDPFAALLWKEKKLKMLLGVRTHTAERELVSIYNSVASRASLLAVVTCPAPTLLVRVSIISFSGSEKKTTTIDWCFEYAILRSLFLACLMSARTTITSENCLLLHLPNHTYPYVASCSVFLLVPYSALASVRWPHRHMHCIQTQRSFLWRLPLCCRCGIHRHTHTRGRKRLRSSREQQQQNWHMCVSSTTRRDVECERMNRPHRSISKSLLFIRNNVRICMNINIRCRWTVWAMLTTVKRFDAAQFHAHSLPTDRR